MKHILIITSSYDRTVDYILEKYPSENFFRFNTDKFSDYSVSTSFGDFTISNGIDLVNNHNCISIYYRKPSLENLDKIISPEYFGFIYKEVFTLVDGIADSFEGNCLTKPSILRYASNKIVQSKVAKKIGFKIPNHSITNCKSVVQELLPSEKIVKPISLGKIKKNKGFEYVQTNLVDEGVSLDELKYCPSYFQSYIDKDYECRLTIIDGHCFPVKIISEDKVDWRTENNNPLYELMEIPNSIRKKCFMLMDALDIKFGCFDFLIKDDVWYFLEVNVNGQWAWLEIELNIDISKKIMNNLKGL
ncbi:MAG: hypothetical protein MJK12_15500 [Colwellia sp.]|nr:hypothetical protein [Colwellia sp.]